MYKLIKKVRQKKIIIFGAGALASKVIKECEKNEIIIDYLLDNDKSKLGKSFEGYNIFSLESFKRNAGELIIIASSYSVEIQQQLQSMGLVPHDDYINFNLLFPHVGFDLKLPGQFNELNEVGVMVNRSIDEVGVILNNPNEEYLYRAIYNNKIDDTKDILRTLKETNFFDDSVIYTEITNKKTKSFGMILRHPYIKYCSDSRNWSFSMIYDGFKAINVFLKKLHEKNLTLKDAHGLNFTIHNRRHKLIDFGSIVKGNLKPHVLKEFYEWFLFPCILMLNKQDRSFYKYNFYGSIDYFMIKSFLNKEDQELLNKLYSEKYSDIYGLMDSIYEWAITYFEQRLFSNETTWSNYQVGYEENILLDKNQWSNKQKLVLELLDQTQGKTLLDIAGNNGWYCTAASKYLQMSGMLIDYDYGCIDNAYKLFKKEKNDFLPLVNDFNDFPNNLKFLKETQYDVVLCLAFIHHLVFSNGFSFEMIQNRLHQVTNEYLIIEFIEPTDIYVSTWINPYFSWYSVDEFEKVFTEKFSIISKKHVSSTRIVYLMKCID